MCIQWNLTNPDTNGTMEIVLINGVSSGLIFYASILHMKIRLYISKLQAYIDLHKYKASVHEVKNSNNEDCLVDFIGF